MRVAQHASRHRPDWTTLDQGIQLDACESRPTQCSIWRKALDLEGRVRCNVNDQFGFDGAGTEEFKRVLVRLTHTGLDFVVGARRAHPCRTDRHGQRIHKWASDEIEGVLGAKPGEIFADETWVARL